MFRDQVWVRDGASGRSEWQRPLVSASTPSSLFDLIYSSGNIFEQSPFARSLRWAQIRTPLKLVLTKVVCSCQEN